MAINIEKEKERVLTTQDMYDIMDFSMQAAEDGGFINSYIYQRALYCFAAIVLYPDRKDELSHIVAENINSAWDTLLQDGTIEMMIQDHSTDLDLLAENGQVWFDEFATYAHSARGLLNTIQEFTGDIVEQAAKKLKDTSAETGVQQILEVADSWGMNSALPKEAKAVTEEFATDSLFE